MPSYAHIKLTQEIAVLDEVPSNPAVFSRWIEAGSHLDFLRKNANAAELAVYGSGPYTFIHSIVVPNHLLMPLDREQLLSWGCNPYTSIASYVYGRDGLRIERANSYRGSKVLDGGKDLVFGRTFEGWSGDDRTYFEINQEYSHLAGVHWRPEHSAYCRFDNNGDLEQVISTSTRSNDDGVTLVSFTWPDLEDYLAVSDVALVRMFDFTLLRRDSFNGWPDGPEEFTEDSDEFFFKQKISGDAAYTRGVQIIRSRRTAVEVKSDMHKKLIGRAENQYVEFIAHDWRNKRIARISTDPMATTNYFSTEGNCLPFELSVAFFRPEVLSKYKTDREKYTLSDRDVRCRAAWSLRRYDVNEAGQIHAYICDLRTLPFSEQLHWRSYNEEPKAGISKRAFVNDFKGEFVTFTSPRSELLSIVQRWRDNKISWWTLRDYELVDRANPPLTTSRDEWAEAMMDLAKLVVEGFEVKAIRSQLDTAVYPYSTNDQSIVLLEKLISHETGSESAGRLVGLRTAQLIRSKVKGHAGSAEGKSIAQDALASHGSFGAHFNHVCSLIVAELKVIERTLERAK